MLRELAMDILALDKDPFVQELLEQGLRNPDQASVAPESALRMLGYDAHAGHYELLQDIVSSSDKPKLRQMALGCWPRQQRKEHVRQDRRRPDR